MLADPCNPSPCGANTKCENGQCFCLPDYHGNPYTGCRPECVLHTDCSRDRACVQHKCSDPCVGTCAVNAICEVLNHIPNCRCPEGMEGNAFTQCSLIKSKVFFTAKYFIEFLMHNFYRTRFTFETLPTFTLWTEFTMQGSQPASGLLLYSRLYRKSTVM